jgi:hypothetical protein
MIIIEYISYVNVSHAPFELILATLNVRFEEGNLNPSGSLAKKK